MGLPHLFTAHELALMNTAQVAVFGFGPVGAWFSYQLKLQNPGLNVLVFERRSEYTRTHALWIDPSWFRSVMHKGSNIAGITDQKKPFQIRANALEALLSSAALAQGVEVIRSKAFSRWTDLKLKQVTRPFQYRVDFEKAIESGRQQWFDTILSLCPQVDRVVGTDGAHSTVRRHFFGANAVKKHLVRRIVQMSIPVDMSAYPDKNIALSYPSTGVLDYRALEHVDASEGGRAMILARFFVGQQTFDRLRQVLSDGQVVTTAGNALTGANIPSHPLVSDSLKSTLQNWYKHKTRQVHRQIGPEATLCKDEAKLTTIALEQSEAYHFQKRDPKTGIDVLLAGDSLSFKAYYTAANSGLRCASWAARAFKHNNPALRKRAMGYFESRTRVHMFFLNILVKLKNFLLTILSWVFSLGVFAPIRLKKWTFEQAGEMHAQDRHRKSPISMDAIYEHRARQTQSPAFREYTIRRQRKAILAGQVLKARASRVKEKPAP